MTAFAAVDLGASSGRVLRAEVRAGEIELHEVHRFANEAARDEHGTLRWDLEALWRGVVTGLQAASRGGDLAGIGIDSWAVDYGLVDSGGALIAPPVAYRDGRVDDVIDRVHAVVDPEELYAITGMAHLPFNTIYQLAAEARDGHLAVADPGSLQALLIPDLLGFRLTGARASELTNASTTALLDQRTRSWSADLLGRLGLPEQLFPPVVQPGHMLGTVSDDVDDLAELSGVPVIAVGSHDTASAVAGLPATAPGFAYISCGTWSLVGVELDEPVLTEAARAANFTNELGVDGRVRFLRNVSGLWLLQESQRVWSESGEDGAAELHELLAGAEQCEPMRTLIDVDDPAFVPPGDMPERIRKHAASRGEPEPRSPAEITRTILDSLALAYRRSVRQATDLSGHRVERVHIVGGGSQNRLLCQLAADAIGLPVVAGPPESTALGNVLIQARAVGALHGTLDELRELAAARVTTTRYTPREGVQWSAAQQRVFC